MKISEIKTMLKIDLVSGGTRTFEIGDHIEVVYKSLSRMADVGYAGILTKIQSNAIRVTDYNGEDLFIDFDSLEEIIDA